MNDFRHEPPDAAVASGLVGAAPADGDVVPFAPERLWRAAGGGSPRNALTCDVEDYFQVSAFENVVPRSSWGTIESRLPRNLDRVLQLFSDAGVTGTFFTLGWIAQQFPELVRRIAAEGHEVASHGMRHLRVWTQQPEQFGEDVSSAKRLLEDVSGTAVRGYRAASWSIDGRTPWAHDVLCEAGYDYSSSLYPITHDHYGVPSAPTRPFYLRSSRILEIPASTVRLAGRNWPAGGGGYFRLLPLRSRCGSCGGRAGKTGYPPSSTSTRGSSIPGNPGSPAPDDSPAFVTT